MTSPAVSDIEAEPPAIEDLSIRDDNCSDLEGGQDQDQAQEDAEAEPEVEPEPEPTPEEPQPDLWAPVDSACDEPSPDARLMRKLASRIPAKPSLKQSCEKCRKRPDQSGQGYSSCAQCKVACYCSRECQRGHWKDHKERCEARRAEQKKEADVRAQALNNNGPFVSQAALRRWYSENIDVVDYAIAQELELYKGKSGSLWGNHAVVFSLRGGQRGTAVQASEISFHNAEALSFVDLCCRGSWKIAPVYLRDVLGAGKRIVVILILNGELELKLMETHELPLEKEWKGIEKVSEWRSHVRMRELIKLATQQREAAAAKEEGS